MGRCFAPAVSLICKGLPMLRSPNSTGLWSPLQRWLFALLVVAYVMPLAGCGFLSHLLYWTKGNQVPAKFPGLKDKLVAVVCFDANSAGPAPETDAVAKAIAYKLMDNDIQVVPHQRVLDWMDKQPENVTDFLDVGNGVKADMVVGIELDSFQTHDGPTLLRGRARAAIKVYDLKQNGKLVYETPAQDYVYPENGSRPISDNEAAFKYLFIDILSRRISKDFYSYDHQQDFGDDARWGG
jgi:hypothetical protein